MDDDGIRAAVARLGEEQGFSGVVSVDRDGEVLALAVAGWADRRWGIENTPSTRFGVASGTKLLTALQIFMGWSAPSNALVSTTGVQDRATLKSA